MDYTVLILYFIVTGVIYTSVLSKSAESITDYMICAIIGLLFGWIAIPIGIGQLINKIQEL